MNNNKNIPSIPFYFIRHGQTDWNLQGLRQGHSDIPLDQTGIEQARAVAPLFSGLGITRIIASPLRRARKTADVINEKLNVPIAMHEGLKECSWGVLEGTPKDTTVLFSDWCQGTACIEGGETAQEFKMRIVDVLCEVLDPNEVTLIVSHGGVYWAIMELLGFKQQHIANCEPHFFNPSLVEKQSLWAVDSVDNIHKQQ